uniref:Uncharacterized protein n=1 Tax=Saimiri boliviensis boliviensis TaxID=39432 RepID=A0A2K6TUT1_SAIBB
VEFQNVYIQLMLLLGLCVSACQPAMPRAALWGHLRPSWVLVPWPPTCLWPGRPGAGPRGSDRESGAALAQALQLPAPLGFTALLVFSERQQDGVHSNSKGGIGLDVLGTSQPVPTLYVNL